MVVLDPTVDSLDSVPEKYREAYREGTKDEGEEGKYVLLVNKANGWALENTEALRSALSGAKEKARLAKDALTKFEGLNADDIRAKIKKLEELEASGSDPDQKKQLEQAIADARADVEKKYEGKLTEREKEISDKDLLIEQLTRYSEIDTAIAKHKGNEQMLRDHLIAISRSEPVKGGAPKSQVLDPKTKTPRVSQLDGNTDDMTIDEYVGLLTKDKTWSAAFTRDTEQKGPNVSEAGRSGRQTTAPNADALKDNPSARLDAYYQQQDAAGRK